MKITHSQIHATRGPTGRSKVLIAGVIGLGILVAACAPHGSVECPPTYPAVYVGADVSQTSRSEALRAARMEDIRTQAEYVALCHGSLKVELFSSGTGATASVFDAHLEAEGATLPARQRKLEETVEPAMAEVTSRWDAAESSLPADGSDVVGQLELMAEYFAQHPNAAHRGLLLTDGVQTAGVVVLNDESVTQVVAVELAESVPAPDLAGAEVTIAGIGRVADADHPPPSSFVSALKRFYDVVCERTGADCLVVTDLSSGGGNR